MWSQIINYMLQILITTRIFTKQWAYNNPVYNINVENVWEKVYNDNISKTETIVAVLDTGVDIYHEDLKDNIFKKSRRNIYGNTEKDDDNNGFVDDIAGWDFLNNDNTVYDNTTDSTGEKTDSHGTHVAGIIAAAKNGVGMQGVAYENVKILPVKFIAGKEGGRSFRRYKRNKIRRENGCIYC